MAALAALLMVLTEFLTVASVDVASGSCEVINDANPEMADRCILSGFERHGGGAAAARALALFMGLGASVGGSRPAALALVVIGALVLGLRAARGPARDRKTGAIGRNFEGAEASPGPGLFAGAVGRGLALGGGLLRLRDRRRYPARPTGDAVWRTALCGACCAVPCRRAASAQIPLLGGEPHARGRHRRQRPRAARRPALPRTGIRHVA